MYYRIALITRPRHASNDPVWGTYVSLVTAGHAVELINLDVYPDALLPDGTVNASLLQPFFDAFRPDLVTTEAESPEAILEACEQSGASGMSVPAKRFVALGYIGEENFGDELVFSLICQHVRDTYPEGYVSLVGHNPRRTLAEHGIVSVDVTDKFAIDLMFNGAAAFVMMAGILFDLFFDTTAGRIDYMLEPEWEIPGQVACVQLAWMHGVPTVYMGIGAGPLSNPDACAFLRLAGQLGAVFCSRDRETARLLLNAGVPDEAIVRTADIALTLASERERYVASDESDVLLVTLRDFPSVDESFAERTARAIDALAGSHDVRPVFLDLAPEDGELHARVRELLSPQMRERAEQQRVRAIPEALRTIGMARAVLATRLHGSIVANAFGIPSVGFDYNEKVRAYYEVMGMERLLLPMDAPADDIERALRCCLDEHDALTAQINARLAGAEADAHAGHADDAASDNDLTGRSLLNFEVLDKTVAQHPNAPRALRLYEKTVAPSRKRAEALEQELVAVREERDHLASELHELKASTSWRVGNALTAPARFVKDRLSGQ